MSQQIDRAGYHKHERAEHARDAYNAGVIEVQKQKSDVSEKEEHRVAAKAECAVFQVFRVFLGEGIVLSDFTGDSPAEYEYGVKRYGCQKQKNHPRRIKIGKLGVLPDKGIEPPRQNNSVSARSEQSHKQNNDPQGFCDS